MESDQAVLDDLNAPEFSQFTLSTPAEIARVIDGLARARSQASLYFNRAPGSSLTVVLGIDAKAGRLYFDPDSDTRRNEAILGSDALAWRSSVDGVRVEFTTGRARFDTFEGAAALVTSLPEVLLRLQRRNAFRTATPIGHPLTVRLDASGEGRSETRGRALDLSALGMCLLVDANAMPVVAGMRIMRAQFDLPGYGEVRCGLEVRYILSAGARHPEHFRRCGVQFIGMAAADEVLISRYINDLQRERAKVRSATAAY